MNDERLDHLIAAHLHSMLTHAERSELEHRLQHSASDREHFWQQAEMHALLHHTLQSNLGAERQPPNSVRWLTWRPLTAAVAGLVIGLFSATLIFGYAMPRAVATASRLFALADGGFEGLRGRAASGFPSAFGVWSGDGAEAANERAVEGHQALRFVKAERESALPNYGAASCDVYQLVDLRPLKADAALGDATLELSVQFRDAREATGEPVKFIGRLYVFSGTPGSLRAEWPLSQKEALAAGSGSADSLGGSPQAWQKVTTRVLLPPHADFAVVHLVAHKPKTPTGAEALFGAQFADDVRLTLKTQPTLPVRLAQR